MDTHGYLDSLGSRPRINQVLWDRKAVMGIHGYPSISEFPMIPGGTMESLGYPWISIDIWISWNLKGLPWDSRDIDGYPWIFIDIWVSWDPDGTKGFHGYSRVFLDNYQYSLISMRLCVPWDPKDVMQIAMSWDMEVP